MREQQQIFTTHTEQETVELGERFAECLHFGDNVFFYGALGCGKTAMIRGIGKKLGVNENAINSPTFVLINQYPANIHQERIWIYHFDLYRLHSPDDIADTGLYEFLNDPHILCLIEWSERIVPPPAPPYWKVEFRIEENLNRAITIEYHQE